jgi:cation-transporting P-type ATPase E
VFVFAFPAGLIAAAATFSAYWVAIRTDAVSVTEARTAATLVLGAIGLWIVDVLARPLSKWRLIMLVVLATAGILSMSIAWLRTFWNLEFPPTSVLALAAAIGGLAIVVIEVGWRLGALPTVSIPPETGTVRK